ncbi:Smr/MutS family protein [Parvularcula sp. LCG005]|uniref:Smr/MutS family protein n=1 Tax=Parvularcula sp. LCG005 TaxID=3078805 RepID=UPI002942CEC9|nr:Smr/MutS family protein [Parvularcula sp. LCG005]WOI53275.1 Smr/MutS family protein [Parvularcula sp. LCG005]
MRRPRKNRPLTPSEAALWDHVTTKVTPLQRRTVVLPAPKTAPDMTPPPSLTPHQVPRVSAPSTTKAKPASSKAPRFGGGDPNLGKRAARGRLPIGASLDLHGMFQAEAEQALQRFLSAAAFRGERAVLVITGKGAPDATDAYFEEVPRGILRQRFLEWVERPPLRGLIGSVQQAHQKHGGRGAFYVFLRQH